MCEVWCEHPLNTSSSSVELFANYTNNVGVKLGRVGINLGLVYTVLQTSANKTEGMFV